jgi:RNA polymerase sigma factor (sigma-70 family)
MAFMPMMDDDYDSTGDGVLLGKFLDSGDEDAFGILTQRHRRMVLRVCRRVCGNEQDAEDAAQITFSTLAERGDRVRVRRSLAGWLHWTAWHVAMRLRRGRESRRRAERRAGVANVASATAAAAAAIRSGLDGDQEQQQALAVEVDRAMSLLPDEYREVLILHHVEGLTVQQAAQRTGWAVGTVASRLSRGRGELRAKLQQRGVTLAVGALVLIIEGEVSSALTGTAAAGVTAVAAVTLDSWARSQAPTAALTWVEPHRVRRAPTIQHHPLHQIEYGAYPYGGDGVASAGNACGVCAGGAGNGGFAVAAWTAATSKLKFLAMTWLVFAALGVGAAVVSGPRWGGSGTSNQAQNQQRPIEFQRWEPSSPLYTTVVPEPGTLSAPVLTSGWMLLRRRRGRRTVKREAGSGSDSN